MQTLLFLVELEGGMEVAFSEFEGRVWTISAFTTGCTVSCSERVKRIPNNSPAIF